MAGRGFSFKPFLKPSVSQEASGSEAKAEGPSVPAILSPAPSTTGSSAVFLPTLGRGIGRGLAFPKTSPPKQDADQSSIITTIGKGRGIAGISGRGMFAMKINVPIEVAETPKPQPLIVGEQKIKTSDPKASDSGPSKVLSNSEIVGRVAAGRGIISSGRGTGSGGITKTGAGSSGKWLRLLKISLLEPSFYFRRNCQRS